MIEELAITVIKDLGFPIFVAGWFMLRTEKVINRNTEAFMKMADRYDLYKKEVLK